jgi:hypothetical protein
MGFPCLLAPRVRKGLGKPMDETDFEGSLVLERLAAIGRVDDFFEAIDADDARRATALMKEAGLDASTIAAVVRKMQECDGQH